jgi:transcription antitermination protein NusB
MRRRGRECALQILYQMDLNKELAPAAPEEHLAKAFFNYWTSFEPVAEEDRVFAERLVRGVVRELDAVDQAIANVSQHWRVGRMDKVDKNLIRLAAYEILRCPDIPRLASINEAIEIAKRFSGKESAAFINGILDQIRREDAPNDAGA